MKHSNEWKANWVHPIIKHNVPTVYGYKVSCPDLLKFGEYIDIGTGTYIQASNGIIIEDDVQIGPNCTILSKNTIDGTAGTINLQKGCCIGANSVIFPNVIVGANTIIGACSLVNKSIESDVIAYGVPCKVKRKL